MKITLHDDAGTFLERARDWLEEAEAENNVVLGVAADLANKRVTWLENRPFFASVEDGEGVVGCAFRTPPYPVGMTRMPLEAVPLVVEGLVERYEEVPGFLGTREVAEAAARAWVGRVGGSFELRMPHRIYRLDEVTPPRAVPGTMRLARPDELPLILEWEEAFARDAHMPTRVSPERQAEWVSEGQLFLWEDQEPVSMTVAQGRTRHGIRVAYVYTPTERRGKGYASALVAGVSQAMLDGGLDFCVLYTDLRNPTSNRIYQEIGYRPLCDVVDVVIRNRG